MSEKIDLINESNITKILHLFEKTDVVSNLEKGLHVEEDLVIYVDEYEYIITVPQLLVHLIQII